MSSYCFGITVRLLGAAAFGVWASAATPGGNPEIQPSPGGSARPNVLFLMTDQQRFDGMSVHGGQARTPHLDRLARGGADLHGYFSAAPVCVPSRCSLFTGRYGHSHGVLENDARLAAFEPHLFKVFKQAGYRLGYVGKNHLLETNEFANFDFVAGHEWERPVGERAAFKAFARERSERLRTLGSWASSAWYDLDEKLSDAYVNRARAIEFLDQAPARQPFFLCVSFIEPHVPHIAPRKFEAQYPLDRIQLPAVQPGVLDDRAPRYKIKQAVQRSLEASDTDRRRYLAVYFSMISWVDENVGAILDALEARGLRGRTIVVFTSDHGDFGFDYGMCKKDLVMPDVLMRVPFLISWPGRLAPRVVVDTLVEEVDVAPTLYELCGLDAPYGVQGRSFAPLLRGETNRHKPAIHGEICYPWMRNPYRSTESFLEAWREAQTVPGHPLRFTAPYNVPGEYSKMLRTREWKYIWYAGGFEELYDLRADPREETNLASRPAHRKTLDDLRLQLFQWQIDSQDPISPRNQKEISRAFSAWK